MALQAVNVSVVEVLGCAEQGNLSMEVTDYNVSCTNSSVLPRPTTRTKGKSLLLLLLLLLLFCLLFSLLFSPVHEAVSHESPKLRC